MQIDFFKKRIIVKIVIYAINNLPAFNIVSISIYIYSFIYINAERLRNFYTWKYNYTKVIIILDKYTFMNVL